jgi:hypothetical protein
MTEKLILACLVLAFLMQLFALIRDGIVHTRNTQVYIDSEERANKAVAEWRQRAFAAEDAVVKLTKHNLAPAMIVTLNGVKGLPEGWEPYVEAAWKAEKTESKKKKVTHEKTEKP